MSCAYLPTRILNHRFCRTPNTPYQFVMFSTAARTTMDLTILTSKTEPMKPAAGSHPTTPFLTGC